MPDLPGQQILIDVVAPLDIGHVCNLSADGRAHIEDALQYLSDYSDPVCLAAAQALDRHLTGILQIEADLIRHARAQGLPITHLVGDTRRPIDP